MKLGLFKIIFLLTTILTLVTLFYLYLIERRFDEYKNTFNSQSPVCETWSHRGIVNDSLEENSLAAFAYAKMNGVSGVEVDVFWIDSLQKCVVMHDLDTTAIPTALRLEDVINRFGDSLKYWIDLKNLTMQNAVIMLLIRIPYSLV